MLIYIKLRRYVYVLTDILSVLFSLPDALREEVFDLPVYGAEIGLCPGGYGVVQLRRKPQRYLFFVVLIHFFPESVQTAAVDYRLGVLIAAEHD